MKMTHDQIRETVEHMKQHAVKPITLSTQRMVKLANEASPFGERFYLLQKVYQVKTSKGSFVVGL